MHEMSLFPKVLWPFNYLTLSQNKPSEFFKCYYLIISAWQWVMSFMYMACIPMQISPIKVHWGTGSWPFFERWATFPPQADHVLADLLSVAASRGPCGQSTHPHKELFLNSPEHFLNNLTLSDFCSISTPEFLLHVLGWPKSSFAFFS